MTDAVLDEALQDNTSTPIPEQVQFRLDFPRWRRSRCERDRIDTFTAHLDADKASTDASAMRL